MANTSRQIKRRISTASNISKITKAMEMVAASKMRKAQAQALKNRAFARAIENSLKNVASHTDADLHPLLTQHDAGQNVLIVVATNKGLCGGLNTNLFRQLNSWIKTQDNPAIIAVGKKAVQFIRKTNFELIAEFVEIPEHVNPEDTTAVSSLVMEKFLNSQFKTVSIIYMDFINTISQKVRISRILPIAPEKTEIDDVKIIPIVKKEYVFEPNPKEILNSLLPYYVENTVYQIFLEAKASEHSARMVAMKNASENAQELVGELKLMFNKSRQASITNELLDITTAALTLN
ncbi:MAG: ATP synthase F1 subunit gamma [Patescibacteria group bacterium]